MNIQNNPDVKKKLNEALVKASNGFVQLSAFNETDNHKESGFNGVEYHVSEYTGKAVVTRVAVIPTSDSTHLETNTDLTKFINVPTLESLSGKNEKSIVYQLWSPGTEFVFSGKAWFFRGENGWEVATNYSGPIMSTVVEAGTKPSGYLILKFMEGKAFLLQTTKPYIEIIPPTAVKAQDFLRKHVEWLSDSLQELVGFEPFGEPEIERLSKGGQEVRIRAKVTLAFTAPAISPDGIEILPAPQIGDAASEEVKEEAYENACYWESGTILGYEASIYFKKEAADDEWTFSTSTRLYPDEEPLKSDKALRVRFKDGKVYDVQPIRK